MTQLVEQLQREGYAVVRGFFGAGEMAQISAEPHRIYAEGQAVSRSA